MTNQVTGYHVTPDGDLKPCRAKSPATCPYGGQPHFETEAEGTAYVEKERIERYGILGELSQPAGVIKEKGNYVLSRPRNSWDMNYRLTNRYNGKEYLIDICDVYEEDDIDEDFEEGDALMWEDFKELKDIEEIKQWAWKVKDS